MADLVSPDVRSRMMSGIRGRDTKPERLVRSVLHRAGYRFRKHGDLPGRPDIVLPKWNAVIFVHGCFWHGHGCRLFKWPESRIAFWKHKISGNIARDRRHIDALRAEGWRVGVVWECALKGRSRLDINHVLARCSSWVKSNRTRFDLAGRGHDKARTAL